MNNNIFPTDNYSNQDPEKQYPELYSQIKPYIDDAVRRYRGSEYDENMLESIIQDILTRSGLTQYMTPPVENDETVPAQRIMPYSGFNPDWGWNPPPRRRRHPMRPWYPTYPYRPYPIWGGISPQDFIRLLLLRRLWGY